MTAMKAEQHQSKSLLILHGHRFLRFPLLRLRTSSSSPSSSPSSSSSSLVDSQHIWKHMVGQWKLIRPTTKIIMIPKIMMHPICRPSSEAFICKTSWNTKKSFIMHQRNLSQKDAPIENIIFLKLVWPLPIVWHIMAVTMIPTSSRWNQIPSRTNHYKSLHEESTARLQYQRKQGGWPSSRLHNAHQHK